MEITAQKRKWPTKLREKANLKGKLLEAFSPEFRELMETLRDVDDKVREEALDLNDLLKVAQTNLNRREYMTAASYLGRFHEKMEGIYQELSRLGNVVDIKHHDFLFGGLEPEHLEYLTTKMSPKLDLYKKLQEMGKKASIEKEAGITDWWHNITTDRGKTLAAWEKRFPKYARELRNQTSNLIIKSKAFYDLLIGSLKVMASYRATRKLEDYLKTVSKLKERFKNYHTAFVNYYNTQIKRFVEYQNALQTTAPSGNVETAVSQPITVPVATPAPPTPAKAQKPLPAHPIGAPPIPGGPPATMPGSPFSQPPSAEGEAIKKLTKELSFPIMEEKPKKAEERRRLLLSLATDLS